MIHAFHVLIPFVTIAPMALSAPAFAVSLTYDRLYDDGDRSLSNVACWNPNVPGLFPDHDEWLVQKNVAPGILAIPTIDGWDHADCVSCWMLEWNGGEQARPLLAIDRSKAGFVTSFERMNSLTEGKAEELKTLVVNATRVGLTNCGFAPQEARRESADEL
ncbi:hypothetical protein BN1723_005893 [Verticillium longisporum]|uniref:Uncharacterized protein n=1 Tax=Verticillium longisporum TaxID=100787 RepID=A0A0G4NBW2_VERLO|nr:hypothetical protein BN1723_005893 [Verticillium longisporum]